MNHAVVIGGAGFIGFHLCRALRSQYAVTVVDNYFTGSEANHVEGVTYIRGEAADIASLVAGRVSDGRPAGRPLNSGQARGHKKGASQSGRLFCGLFAGG